MYHLFLVLGISLVTNADKHTLTFEYLDERKDSILADSNKLVTMQTASHVECAVRCSRDNCQTYFYNSEEGFCKIYPHALQSTDTFIISYFTHVYSIRTSDYLSFTTTPAATTEIPGTTNEMTSKAFLTTTTPYNPPPPPCSGEECGSG